MIILRILTVLPHIESFVDNKQPQPVAGIKKSSRRWVMGGTHGIVSIRFHQLHFTFFGPIVSLRSQRPVVVMDTSAFQFQRHTVEKKPFLSIHGYGTDSKSTFIFVFQMVIRINPGSHIIQIRGIGRPKLRRLDFRLLSEYIGIAGIDFLVGFYGSHPVTCIIGNNRLDHNIVSRRIVVYNGGFHNHHCGCSNISAVSNDVQRIGYCKPHVAIKT